MKPRNPFVVAGYAGAEYFCDREAETRRLLSAVDNGRNVTLIAPRRYGKTGLIRHVQSMLPKGFAGIYLDIFALRNLSEFARTFASAVVGSLDTPVEKAIASVARFFKSCRPTATPQEDGSVKFSFDVVPQRAGETIAETFSYLKRRERCAVIAIDEFQQILQFPESGTEALLRGLVQDVPWTRFVFSGSRHHLMGEMFLSAKHPFYQSTDMMSLGAIGRDAYAEFAHRHFSNARSPFKRGAFDALYDRFDGITWYVQAVLNRIWEAGIGFASPTQVESVVRELVEERSLVFRDLYFSQSESAQDLLQAIASEGVARNVFSGDFLRRHALKATSTVRSTLNALVADDIVYRTETGYVIYDRLFGEWLKARNGE